MRVCVCVDLSYLSGRQENKLPDQAFLVSFTLALAAAFALAAGFAFNVSA